MNITILDINRRLKNLNTKFISQSNINMREAQIYTSHNIFCENNAINSINNWKSLGDTSNEAFNKALDIFDELCMNSNKSIIETSCNILLEDINKVRNQTELLNSIKYRMSRMKRKPIQKLNYIYDNIDDTLKSKLNTKDIKPGNNINNNSNNSQNNNINNTPENNQQDDNKNNIAQECYKKLYEKCISIKECDRILENYNNISKRFNIDRVISNINYPSDLYQACLEISSYIDTYNIPFKNKYNSALETVSYVFDKHYMNYSKDKIIEAVTDYFIFSGSLKESQIKDVISVMNISVLFEQSDFLSLSWLIKKEEPKFKDDKIVFKEYGGISYLDISDLDKIKENYLKDVSKGNPDERKDSDIHNMVNDFRYNCIKDKDNKNILTLFKNMINKIFTKNPDQIVHEVPNLLSIIRYLIIISSLAINPILGVITLLGNLILKMHLDRKQADKIYKAYKNEIASVKTKIEKTKDEKNKERLEKYKAELEKDLDKIKEYESKLYTDEENDEKDTERYAAEHIDDDDDDFSFDWNDDDFKEAVYTICIANYMDAISENLIDDTVDGIVYNNIYKLDNDTLDLITDFSITVPVILEKDKLRESLINYRNSLRKSITDNKDYIRIDCVNENIYKLDKSGYSYNTTNSCRDTMLYLACLNEITKMKNNDYVLELNFCNTIKLAVNNLKKAAMNLSDKEKQISSSIDVAANNVSKSIEKSMMNDNREAVIRGSILPSASKCIKYAITFVGAWALNPAIAVISAVGAFACSKKLQAKERQLVLDDIEIELKMCDRYIKAAEEKNDMKKIRQIEKIQRNLERQRQRIKYKMITIYHQTTPDVKSNDE